MQLLEQYNKVEHLLNDIQVDKVYPCSILEGVQSGEIFVDDINKIKSVLFWHYSGFGYIAGECDDYFLTEIVSFMRKPRENHSGRLALQTGNDGDVASFMERFGIEKKEQYLFEYTDHVDNNVKLDEGFSVERITLNNYELLEGRIIPDFSWENKEKFAEKGYGYCIFHKGEFAACAFSAGISEKYVDIGVETAEKYRGKGYGKYVTLHMIDEILRRKQIPIWECNTTNEASKKLACSAGFRIKGVHPLYIISKDI